jgi:predicted nucleic acid-binding Zn ribbon protein
MTRKIGKKSQPVAVSGLLDEIFQGKPLEKRLREGRIWMVWDSAVGTQIAAKARPVNFRDGVLTVMVSNAPWMQQLSFLKKGLIEKVNAALGEDLVREIYLKAGMPDRLQKDPRPAKKAARPLTAAETERIDKETADIDDPELREAIASLLTKHLSNTPEE